MNIYDQIYEALDNEVENGWGHDHNKEPYDYVLDIYEKSGIKGFNLLDNMEEAADAVRDWRAERRECDDL